MSPTFFPFIKAFSNSFCAIALLCLIPHSLVLGSEPLIPTMDEFEFDQIDETDLGLDTQDSVEALKLSENELVFAPLFPEKGVREALNTWIKAWNKKDLVGYFESFDEKYSTHVWMSHEEWEKRKRKVFRKNAFIEVTISDLSIKSLNELTYHAQFKQAYRSSTLNDTTLKRVTFAYQQGRWLITRIQTLKKF